MSVAVKKLTWADIQHLPEYHGRTEIVDGVLVMSPVPAAPHQEASTLLGSQISRQRKLGKFFLLGSFGPGQPVVTRVLEGLVLDPARIFGEL